MDSESEDSETNFLLVTHQYTHDSLATNEETCKPDAPIRQLPSAKTQHRPLHPLSTTGEHTLQRARRWSTLDDYYQIAKKKDWLAQERAFLTHEAIQQQTPSPPTQIVLGAGSKISDYLYYDKSRDLYTNGDSTWGQLGFTLYLTATPLVISDLLYSRKAGRIVGSCVSIVFTILGLWLLFESQQTVSIEFPYTLSDNALDFQLYTPMPSPIYLYTTFTKFWQNARDFVNSQPPYLGRGYRCHGFQTAGQFCAVRPEFHPPLFPNNTTFCSVPTETIVTPCGMNALWINKDKFILRHINSTFGTTNRESVLTGIIAGEHASILKHIGHSPLIGFPVHAIPKNQDTITLKNNRNISDTQMIESDTTLGHNLLSNLSFIDMQQEENKHKKELNVMHDILNKKQTLQLKDDGIKDSQSYNAYNINNKQDKQHKIRSSKHHPIIKKYQLLHRNQKDNNSFLNQHDSIQHTPNNEDPYFIYSTQPIPSHSQFDDPSFHSHQSLKVPKEEPTSQMIQGTQSHSEKIQTLQNEHILPTSNQEEIIILSTPEVLLTDYQRFVSYPKETAIIEQHFQSVSSVPWIQSDDLQWFTWRRPAPTSSFVKLVGRIDTDLLPGKYRIEFPVNEFPQLPSSTKGIRIISSLSIFGSSQFVGAAISFFIAGLYCMFWFI